MAQRHGTNHGHLNNGQPHGPNQQNINIGQILFEGEYITRQPHGNNQ